MNRFICTFVLLCLIGCATKPPKPIDSTQGAIKGREGHAAEPLLAPYKSPKDSILLDHRFFIVSYNRKHRLANYSKYTLTRKNIKNSKFKRSNKFLPDLLLKQQGIEPVKKSDYTRSGYDRGHLAPAEDFSDTREGTDETFVMSNMTPQSKNLNETAWKYLEARVRRWACGEEKITVISGPILENGLSKLRESISIPKRFFKAVLDETPPRKTVCFIYNQEDSKDVYRDRAMSVKDCEMQIGFTLFSELPTAEHQRLTGTFDLEAWREKDCKGE